MIKEFILIDDDPIFNFLTSKVIESSECSGNITSFTEVEKAINYLKKLPDLPLTPRVIFLDIRMPILDGFDFLEHFHSQVPLNIAESCKIYMLTSSLNDSDKEKAFSYEKVCGFLSKPLESEKMDELCTKGF
ncbi:MAG: response regulator, partial [Proteobacteria bacterium]|nr:response regulator [Pseudomonadota bacterium]